MAKTATATYAPVVSTIRDQINNGELSQGDWLPSETGLMKEHGVSRYSAREALKRLAAEGLITVVDGKGSYVRNRTARATRSDTRALWLAPPLTPSGKPAKTGKARVLDAETQHATTDTTATGWTPADVDLALVLGVAQHTPVFTAERHMSIGHGETGHARYRLFIPATTAAKVPALKDNPDCTPDELYAVLDKARMVPAGESLRWTETVRATVPTADDTAVLNLEPGAVILITRRTTHTPDGQVLAMEETRRNAENTQLSYTLTPTEAPAMAGRTI